MAKLDFSRARIPPYQHQREDAEWLIERHWALIAWEMRIGKSKLCIDTFQFLFEQGKIDKVVIVAPAAVRDGVWYDQQLGQLNKHLWADTPAHVFEYHSNIRAWRHGPVN